MTGRLAARLGLVLVVGLLATTVVLGQPRAIRPTVAVLAPPPVAEPLSAAPDLGNLDEDIGAVMVISWKAGGQEARWPTVQSLLVDGRVGGVLLLAANFGGDPASLKQWSDRLTALAAKACLDHPILLMVDQEGGAVTSVRGNFAPPSQLVAGAGGADRVRALEQMSAEGLRASGVGLNLAPVTDVRTNARDAVIGDRSFGSNPAVVAPLVAAAVQGLHAGGVGATLKHFPGLGGAAGDPHKSVPTDPSSEADWQGLQMPAFQSGIAAGADAVMTTAVYVPALAGDGLPAMFSAPVVGRLRTQFGFGGVIVTDSLSMGGIGAKWSLPEAAVMALAAGNDMLLLGNGDPSYEAEAIAAVRAAVLSGRLDRAKLHDSAMRVNALRDRWGRQFTHCRTRAPAV
jgi:beta-N-acetylhexosaminidase